VKAVFDTNILVDLLNGVAEANNEVGRYSHVAISRISWIEVLNGVREQEDHNRVESLLGFFRMIELDEAVSGRANRPPKTVSAQGAGCSGVCLGST
jgi:predicted nucleic acid-binding protein